jgi:hypothetical protein
MASWRKGKKPPLVAEAFDVLESLLGDGGFGCRLHLGHWGGRFLDLHWRSECRLIFGNDSQRVKRHPKFTFIQEISGVGVGQLYTDSLENRKVMRFNFNSKAALFVDMASSNHDKHLSMLNSHHEFVRFINPKLRVVAASVKPTAYDS